MQMSLQMKMNEYFACTLTAHWLSEECLQSTWGRKQGLWKEMKKRAMYCFYMLHVHLNPILICKALLISSERG